MRAALGHSDECDGVDAIADAIAQCELQLEGEVPKGAFLSASVDYDHAAILERLQEKWPNVAVAGSTTDGELSHVNGYQEDSVLLVAFAGDIEARAIAGPNLSADPEGAMRRAIEAADGFTGRLAMTAVSPLTDGNFVARQLQELLGPDCAVVGGLSADHREFKHVAEFCGTEVLQDSVVALVLSGDFQMSHGIGSGWFPIGAHHEVTKSSGHFVQEIDGRPAVEVYRDYWGEVPQESLGEYPIAVYPDGVDGDFILRASFGYDEEGTVRFAGDVPLGTTVRITEVLPDGILAGSTEAMEMAISSYEGDFPEIALAFSCAARKWVLGSTARHDCASLREGLRRHSMSDLRVAGGYYFGEIGPMKHEKSARLHNESCVAVILGN